MQILRGHAPTRGRRQLLVEHFRDLVDSQILGPCRCDLDRERDSIHPLTDVHSAMQRCIVESEVRAMHDGAVQEQRNRIGIAQRPLALPPIRQPQRFEPIDGFAEKAKRLAAGHKYS